MKLALVVAMVAGMVGCGHKPKRIIVSPESPAIFVGQSVHLYGRAVYDDNTSAPIPRYHWTSSDPVVVSWGYFDGNLSALCLSAGRADVEAELDGVVGKTDISCVPPPIPITIFDTPAEHVIEIKTVRETRKVKSWADCGADEYIGSYYDQDGARVGYLCTASNVTRELWIDGVRWGVVKGLE